MGSDFFTTTIGEQLTLQRGFDITKKEQMVGNVPVVSSGGISSFHNIAKVSAPGVVLGRKGSLGTVYFLKENYWPHDTTLWVKDFKGNNPRFIYYFFEGMACELKKMDVGAANPSLNRNHVHLLKVKWPSIKIQDKIVVIASSLDDKITLNRQINQTLEQMAQALFKSWFVDFDPVVDNALDAGFFERDLEFSDELLRRAEARKAMRERADFKPLPEDIRKLFPAVFEECSEPSLGLGGWVPEGWCVVVSGEEIDVRDGTHDSPKKSDHGYPLVTSKNLTSGRLDLTDTYLISPKDYEEVNKRSNVNKGDILLTMIGTLGIPCLVSTNDVNFAIKNVGLFRTSETPQLKNYFFELLKSKGMQQFLDSRAAGTTQKYLSLKVLRNIFFIIPCCKVLTEFNTQAYSLENKIQQNDEQNAELAKLRDTLLPKLISGELRLSDNEVDTGDEVLA